MASLHEMQSAFADAILRGNDARIATMIAGDGMPEIERVGIYRNNSQIGFANALGAEFPIVKQLGGEEWFSQTARGYQRAHPSRSGNLHHIGAQYSTFLATELKDTRYKYFSDVAALEWAYQEVLIAADEQPLDLSLLSKIPPADYGALIFRLHPAVRLVSSDYAILKIWQAHQPGAQTTDCHLDESQLVLVQRCSTHVRLAPLDAGEFQLLAAFARGVVLADAIEAATRADASFDGATSLPRLAQLGVFVSIQIDRQRILT
jgi:hypothetical protein